MFRSPLQPIWDLTIYPLGGPASSLAHCPVSGSDTICNSSSPLLTDIVRFGSLRIAISLTVLRRPVTYYRQSHSLKHVYYKEGLALLRPVSRTVRFDPLRIVVSLMVL